MLYEKMDEDSDPFKSFSSSLTVFNEGGKKMPKQLSRLLYRNFGSYKQNSKMNCYSNDSGDNSMIDFWYLIKKLSKRF